MRSQKTSTKTPKAAEKAAAPPPEKAAAETSTPQRTSKSSRTKKSEGVDMTSGKHLHKSAAPVALETAKPSRSAVVRSNTKMLSDAPTQAVDAQQIAELAYSYWLERGGHHGYAEEDWLRAERELATAR